MTSKRNSGSVYPLTRRYQTQIYQLSLVAGVILLLTSCSSGDSPTAPVITDPDMSSVDSGDLLVTDLGGLAEDDTRAKQTKQPLDLAPIGRGGGVDPPEDTPAIDDRHAPPPAEIAP